MADLRMEMTEPIFRMQYRVIYGDTDAGGLVYNANYLRFMEMGRTEMMRSHGLPYSEMEKEGIILPVTECYLRYKASGRYDDLISIATSLAEVTRLTIRFHYRIYRIMEKGRELLLVKGFTKHACIDRQGKLTSFSEKILTQISTIRPL
ncbi:MAG: acyl-CoA thioester hydrolase [Candidatus Electronema aureum]|uniref:Acyl-CoA thioester hydrolase n=1 Tax=Candidatus Electronema aureum TaxID=2005002 RepID=A0A521G569_9BACT|nr:MAG: acyl-CoA thioester hydrolase [Candidatus Electronema aureum]